MKFATKKYADEVIRRIKENHETFYFGNDSCFLLPSYLSFSEMKDIFRSRGFGEPETNLILASLVKAGCKFTI